jgi:hypothetical protein
MSEPMGEKKGHLRVTIDVEVNQELLDAVKENMTTMAQHIPQIIPRRGNEQKP